MFFKCSIRVIIVLLLPGLTLASTVISGEWITPLREPRYEERMPVNLSGSKSGPTT